MASLAEQASKLLDFNLKLDINLLDNVVICMYSGVEEQRRIAQDVLTNLKEHPDAWTRVDAILEFSSNQQTKYYALQILEQVIKTRWKILPRTQCEGIKKYIVGLIIKTSSDPELMEKEKVYLTKLNMILVQVLKREWPKNWRSFIPDIIGASKTNESLCQNNMAILKLLSEEVFDFSSGSLTQSKANHLKNTMCSEFSDIFHLCFFVLENSQNAPLVAATLETLLKFLNWIPLGYIFETQLITILINKFLDVPLFRNVTLKCLTEISCVKTEDYDKMFILLFTQTMTKLQIMLPVETNICEAYSQGQDQEQNFIQNLALFLCSFLKEHGDLIEKEDYEESLLKALHYLVLISEVEEVEIFKICLEYWQSLSYGLLSQNPDVAFGRRMPDFVNRTNVARSRKLFYYYILCKVRYILVSRMAKPKEVLVVENEFGEVVREFMTDTDSINLYNNMRETLVYLAHLDYNDTERIMTEKLQNQVNGTEWSWKNLNTLCWAIGSISGALYEEDEKRFLVTVIKDLLGLCEQKKGKDNKAIIASNIMYVVGQYPRFLRGHWKFLKTVVNKLFEFMHETHDGVQDMACDTFIKIAMKCGPHFVVIQQGENVPFIEEILVNIGSIICDLQQSQVHTFYEAVGYMIKSNKTSSSDQLIKNLMLLPNQLWDEIIAKAKGDVEILKDVDTVRQLIYILRTNISVCKSVGHPYVVQLGYIYLDALNVYKVMSENITTAIALNGENITKQPIIKAMRGVKKEILKLISDWIENCSDINIITVHFLPLLLETVLLDYQRTSVPAAREPEVLSTMTTIVKRLEESISNEVPKIFDAVFQCTLDMISKDFEEFPEHRSNFYRLLHAVVSSCFPAIIHLTAYQSKLFFDSIVWAFKHTMRDVSESGLNIMYKLLVNIEKYEKEAQTFYRMFFTDILEHILSVVTDSSHSHDMHLHATILAHLFNIVEMGRIQISNCATTSDSVLFVQKYVANLLQNAFPHLTDNQIKITVQGLFNLDQNIPAFKDHLRDFLVQIREHAGEDDSDLFLEEREAALRQAQEEKRQIQMLVPGVLNPHEMPDERVV